MNKEQQIEEMAHIMCEHYNKGFCAKGDITEICEDMPYCCYKNDAEALYNAGYRKIENANGHNLPHEIDYLLTEFDEMGFAPTSLCDNPEGKAKLWKSALVYEIGLLLDEYAAIKEKAVKEFAEKVKAKSYVNDYCREVVEIEKIDELLKEYENGKDKD